MKKIFATVLIFTMILVSMNISQIANAKTTKEVSTERQLMENVKVDDITLSGSAHVQSYGDVDGVCDDKTNTLTLGTLGEAKRLESINIKMTNNTGLSGNLVYRVHRQTYGWSEWLNSGENAGTKGEGKRLEGIEIKLTGELAQQYSVIYSTHIQTYGWSQGIQWNGGMAGTQGESKRLECIQVKIVPKNVQNTTINYRVHRQTFGWETEWKTSGDVSGTIGQSKRLEGIEIALSGNEYDGNIEYNTHVQSYGWLTPVTNNRMSGTTGEAKRLEAITIKLTGDIENYYDIYYRVHSQTYGWLNWAKNGDMAGTSCCSKRLEAIQIVLVKKNEPAPPQTYNGVTTNTSFAYLTYNNDNKITTEKFFEINNNDNSTQIVCQTIQEGLEYKIFQLPMEDLAGGMCYAIELPNGKLIMIDSGYVKDGDYVYKFIKNHGGNVEAWFITHPHIDHVGGLIKVLQNDSYSDITIDAIYYNPFTTDYFEKAEEGKNLQTLNYAVLFKEFEELRKSQSDIDFISVKQGDEINSEGVSISCLFSFAPDIWDVNTNSLVLRLEMKGVTMMITGDITDDSINHMIDTYGENNDIWGVDFLQMPHHGYIAGISNDSLYKLTTPKYAFVDCSTNEYENNAVNIREHLLWLEDLSIPVIKRFEGINTIIIN